MRKPRPIASCGVDFPGVQERRRSCLGRASAIGAFARRPCTEGAEDAEFVREREFEFSAEPADLRSRLPATDEFAQQRQEEGLAEAACWRLRLKIE